jgi:hypothetical protein
LTKIGQLWALQESQLRAKMGMGNATIIKLQIMGQLLAKYDESNQWAEMGLGLKQDHKYQI